MNPIPAAFAARKEKILELLSRPDSEYTDLSPKGSVDEGVRDLIDLINSTHGLVTTSSCAGRISVFLEGKKAKLNLTGTNSASILQEEGTQPAKGLGGEWLFVSHDPIAFDEHDTSFSATRLFGLQPSSAAAGPANPLTARLVKFQFEPMILHVLTATLPCAASVLSAASSAGFRESGLQSLRCLSDSHSFPVVAIRTAGLSIGSIIGYVDDEGIARSLVEEEYLRLLLRIANERFITNVKRIERLKSGLAGMNRKEDRKEAKEWESQETRRERKRAEGLRLREERNEELGRIQGEGGRREVLDMDEQDNILFDRSDNILEL